MGDTLGEMMEWAKAVDRMPQQPQFPGSLVYQLNLLKAAANKLGLYDAADWLSQAKPSTIARSNRAPEDPGQ